MSEKQKSKRRKRLEPMDSAGQEGPVIGANSYVGYICVSITYNWKPSDSLSVLKNNRARKGDRQT